MKRKKNTFHPPGTAIYTGSRHDIEVLVNYVSFDNKNYDEQLIDTSVDFVINSNDIHLVQWYDIRGLHDISLIESIASVYGMHPISIENAVDINQRPIYMEFEDGHFLSFKHIYINEKFEVSRQNVSLYFGEGYVLSFQEDDDDLFSTVRERIKKSGGRIRSRKSDYLAYSLLDYCVDRYFGVLDIIEERIEGLENQIANNTEATDKSSIYDLKKELLKVRKSIGPLREAVGQFNRSESQLIEGKTMTFVRDVYDHTIQITDNVDSLRDVLSGLQDLYISEVSLKMNRIMQFLTIVTAIFVPLSFLTGLYGMNFENIPELKVHNGYFLLWIGMITLTVGMLLYFRRKRWL